MEDILELEEVTEETHSDECFCQLCRPVLVSDQDEAAIMAYDPVAA